MNELTAFLAYVDVRSPDECWEWQGLRLPQGYGVFVWKGKMMRAHVAAYRLFVGPIPIVYPEILVKRNMICVCHNCLDGDNPACVNYHHLWLGTQLQNVKDCIDKGRRGMTGGRGERNGNARFKLEEVERIRYLYKHGYTNGHLARKFDVSTTAISYIVNYVNWKQ